METNKFTELSKINVNDHTEKKNGLTYLSWAWAVNQLLQQDPMATWEYREPVRFNDTLMVFCTVTAFGKAMTAQLPVMNHRNQAIQNPDAFQVNVAMQRCLAKAIALHGIGLYIYAGEDLPEEEKTVTPIKPQKSVAKETWETLDEQTQNDLRNIAMEVISLLAQNDAVGAYEYLESQELDATLKTGLWSLLDSKQRSTLKQISTTKKAA